MAIDQVLAFCVGRERYSVKVKQGIQAGIAAIHVA
jgi:hypothetical protein